MAEEDVSRLIAIAKKHTGVARASLTHLSNRLKDLEEEPRESKTHELACRMSQKLTYLDTEFRSHHHALIDLIEDEESLAREQELLDSHDDLIAELTVRVKGVVSASSPSSTEPCRRIAFRTLTHVWKSLDSIHAIIYDDSTSDVFLLQQYEERTIDIRKDLAKTRDDLHQMELEETDKLYRLQDELKSQVFDCSVKLLSSTDKPYEPSSFSPDTKGVKFPKLDVPTLTVTFFIGVHFGSSFAFQCMIGPITLMRKS